MSDSDSRSAHESETERRLSELPGDLMMWVLIVSELLVPQEASNIAEAVRNPEMARQVYAASLLAITVDTQAEQQYLSDLAEQLGLDARTVEAVHQQLGR